MKRALFIDRDGTINVDCPYCSKPEDIKMYVDAIDLIKSYRKFGYLVIVITNQSGIGRKFFSEKELVEFNDSLNRCLRKFGASVDRFYYCPHLPEDKCECRKPNGDLVVKAVKDYDIDLTASIMVGDRDDIDGEMARRLGMHYKILTRKNNEKIIKYSECQ